MSKQSPPPTEPPATRRFLPVLLLLFAGSGCSALIYEIVWFQLLQLVIGSSAVSLGVLLATFMGGMCLGSLTLPRFVSADRHPLCVYAVLELAIGATGLLVLLGVPVVGEVYAEIVGHGLLGILLRGVVCGICLLPPTVLMGATLPAIARWVEPTPAGVSWLGFFYGGNIAGAVLGCLLAGFYLLSDYDMATATYVAIAVNVAVAGTALLLSLATTHHASVVPAQAKAAAGPGNWSVYLVIGISGASALAAEVVWTRLLSLMLGATVYTFSIILAVFLIGLGLGSSIGSFLTRSVRRPGVALGACQLLLGGAVAWAAFMLARSLPYWPVNPYASTSRWFAFQLDLARCLWAVLPAACLWGASFPLALAAAAPRSADAGRLVGRVYAANTVGAIVGAAGTSLLLISWIGTQHTQQILIGLSAVAGVIALVPQLLRVSADDEPGELAARATTGAVALVAIGLVVLLACYVPRTPWELIAYGRELASKENKIERKEQSRATLLFMDEGMNSSVAVTQYAGDIRYFHVSGKVEASTEPQDMRLQRMLGHLPALLHPRPRKVLVVGCGAGVTSGSFVVHPEVERIVICDIEPLVPRKVAPYFAEENYHVVTDKRVEIVFDDARHYILTTQEKFDIITSDPIHPWVKGSATLYTKEYFELCKRRLNPGGFITQWVPLYESGPDVVKSEFAMFFEAFPHGTVWGNLSANGDGYDVVLLGQVEPLRIDVDAMHRRLQQPEQAAVAKSLGDVQLGSAIRLLSTYAGQASDLAPWLEGAEINRDSNLRLQYLAGLWLTLDVSKTIYADILTYRRFPEEVFVGSGPARKGLYWALMQPFMDR